MQNVVQLRSSILFIMRCSFIILAIQITFGGLLLAGNVKSQNLDQVKINIALRHASIQESLLSLQRKSGIRISFFDEVVQKESKKVNLNSTNITAGETLRNILSNTNLTYRLVKDYVIIDVKPSRADKGKIYGKIVDDKGESLPGANIRLLELNTTSSSTVDGSYSITAAPGTYTVEVSYISYQTKRIADVVVTAGNLTKLDVVLLTASTALKAVVIQSSYKRESVAGLYAQQKNAAGITDGLSAEQMARTPDNNMGQVLKRVSGLSTVDNRYVIVRGLTERYNQGMIDGITLPSTDMNRRNFAFDVIPVEMVSNVVVNKTATPDISAEFAGGQVSVNTLDIPLENFTILSAGTGFNTLTLGKDFIESGRRGKYDFWGFDDGHRSLPPNIQSWGSGNPPDYAVPQSKLFNPDAFKRYSSTGGANQNYRLSLGRVYTLKSDQKIGFVTGFSLRHSQETNEFQDVRGFEGNYGYPVAGPNYIDSVNRRRNGHIYKYNTTIGAQVNVGTQGKGYKIGLKNLYSQIFNNTLNSSQGMIANVGFDNDDARSQKNLQDPEITRIFQHKLDGEHTLTSKGLKLTWLGAITSVRQEVKDRTKFTYQFTGRNNGVEYYQTPNVVNPAQNSPDYDYRLFTDTKETDYNWAGSLSQPFNFLGDKSLFKGGYSGIYKQRGLSATTLKIRTEDRAFDSFGRTYEEILAPENIGAGTNSNQAYYLADGGNGSQFNGTSRFHAFYLMLDQRFLKKIRIVYGMRGEKYELKNRQPLISDQSSLRNVTGENNTTYLPSANLTYSITSKMNFRASFAKTVIRPDFRETSYFGFYDPFLNADIVGDDVVSTKINNSDLRYEWYPSAGEIISVSGFYKSFDKPIELVVDQDATGKVTRYRFQNQKDAVNYGIEMEVRKSLGFIADKPWLRNTTLFGNGTIIKSSIHTLSTLGDGSIVENKETRALYGQSPYSVNAGVSYSASRYGFTVNYNRSGRRTYTISSNPNLTEYENGRDLVDLQVYGRFLKQKMEVKLNIGNLLNSTSFYYLNSNGYKQESGTSNYTPSYGTDKYDKEFDLIRYRIKYGITPNLSVTYKF
ncbi:TonB-dependent receptor domain-containing protein [Mucilaginibacter paludis]|uniref:TonB-dependent receptor plug n=1 Tax=Mucilaginibacter paludis DSM 18603 TaxID=714943 RepID=H1Y6I9_9SPHI|nr:TonB-dependent receptor [Mucilaginibacter paludis]EHQ25833.1 TonB-dependent receptor plug [Mucilaginibacter paludis DSM 18603]